MIDNMDGLALLQLIRKQFPHIIRLAFCEEKNLVKIIHCINNTDIFRYIEKPVNSESLIKTLHDAVAQFFLNRDKSQLILQLSQKNEELKYLAMHDDLTGLYNILPDFDKDKAFQKSKEIQALMAKTPYLADKGSAVSLKASYGISTFPEDAKDLPMLLAKADALMFDVKNKGKNAIGV
jgi:PleD family two-component response regulator